MDFLSKTNKFRYLKNKSCKYQVYLKEKDVQASDSVPEFVQFCINLTVKGYVMMNKGI